MNEDKKNDSPRNCLVEKNAGRVAMESSGPRPDFASPLSQEKHR